jgi:formate/nitrite transporter FocA (FNT family)
MPSMRILVVAAFAGIVFALASAGFFMLRSTREGDQPVNRNMARALAWRVGISIALFLFILLSYKLGWIRPTGIPISA